MKNKILILLVTLSTLLVTSCSEDGIESDSLAITQESVNFKKEASEFKIGVTTNNEDWTAIGSSDWIEVVRQGSDLVIKAAENGTIYSRKGKVLIVSGSESATIEVVQESTLAIVTPGNLIVSEDEGEKTLEVHADKDWTVKTDANWLKLTAEQHKSKIIFHYDKNYDKDRVAKIEITIGDAIKTIEVKQLGRLFFLLPYPSNFEDATREKIIKFEDDRLSTYNTKLDNTKDLSYYTRSTDLFPLLDYYFSEDGKLEKIVATGDQWGMDSALQKKEDGFKTFLIENGYVQREDNKLMFENKEIGVRAKIKYIEVFGAVTGSVEYKKIVEQPAMATFETFPKLYTKWGVKKVETDAYEATIAGVYNEEYSTIDESWLTYDILSYEDKNKAEEGKRIIRLYNIEHDDQPKKGLLSSGFIIENKELVFWETDGDVFITKEFKALAKKEGFEFSGMKNRFFQFKNKTKNLDMLVGTDYYAPMNKYVINLGVYESEEDSNDDSHDHNHDHNHSH